MRDKKKWRLSVAEFHAIRTNVPDYVTEEFVSDYHAVLDRMSAASEEDLDSFRIPAAELKPRLVSFHMMSGRKNYSEDNYCDSNLFQRRIDALTRYLPHIQETMSKPEVSEDSKDYDLMSDEQLEQLADKFHIGGYGRQHGIDRRIIIKALRERDRAMEPKPATNQVTIHGSMIGSSLQQGSHGSTATVNYSLQEQKEFIAKVRQAIPELGLTSEQKQAINTDLATAELQLNSGNPRKAIMDECWSSVRSILEKTAASLVAAPLLHELAKLMHW